MAARCFFAACLLSTAPSGEGQLQELTTEGTEKTLMFSVSSVVRFDTE